MHSQAHAPCSSPPGHLNRPRMPPHRPACRSRKCQKEELNSNKDQKFCFFRTVLPDRRRKTSPASRIPHPASRIRRRGLQRGLLDRKLKAETTFDGAGLITGDLTPECAAVVAAVLESLSAPCGRRTPGSGSAQATEMLRHAIIGKTINLLLHSMCYSDLRRYHLTSGFRRRLIQGASFKRKSALSWEDWAWRESCSSRAEGTFQVKNSAREPRSFAPASWVLATARLVRRG